MRGAMLGFPIEIDTGAADSRLRVNAVGKIGASQWIGLTRRP